MNTLNITDMFGENKKFSEDRSTVDYRYLVFTR